MKWHRDRPGLYSSGPFTVTEVAEGWAATGPGLVTREDCLWDTKAAAQVAAMRAAERRAGPEVVDPVAGDVVIIDDGRRGHLTAILDPPASREYGAQRTYLIKLPRGKRLCLFRGEFRVVVP